ncbi:hypothetical protein KKG61_08220 [bacterium]|nr:hypothetical protein [bacterium]MBU1600067.1 hypothetical protein [bacterium]MBU2462425.1 hypothetical protein [bacterium]
MLKINITFPEKLLEEVDSMANQLKKKRSRFLRDAVEVYIQECKRSIEEMERRRDIEEAMVVQDRLRKKTGDWDGVAELRKWRDSR